MANLVPKRFYIGDATGGSSVYTLTSNVGSYAIVRSINACNTTGSDATFDLHIVPSGDTADSGNKILSSITVPANDVITSDAIITMEPSDAIYFNQSGTSITLTVSGVEYDAG